MCDLCNRADLAAAYRKGGRSKKRSLPCRNEVLLADLVVRSAPIEPAAQSSRRRRKPANSAQPRREVG
jgi:hypothetical protein